MRFEKITENKIRITFNIEDLEKDNIDFHSFMSNSIESQSIFLDMLSKAEKEIGFITNNYQLVVEALATSNGNFIVTVTRMLPDTIKLPKEITDLYSNPPQGKRKLSAKRKTISANMPAIVYQFESFDDFCNLSNCLNEDVLKKINKIFVKSVLYLYNNSYYLSLKTSETAILSDVKYVLSTVTEFSTTTMKYSNIFERKLIEYGKVILANNCFLKVNKFFAR